MTRPILLDLFCCAGGAAMGYYRAGFDVVGIDNKPQKHYPFMFEQADALEYARLHGHEFDAIHASPPCQRYSVCTPTAHKQNHPDLIAPTRAILQSLGKPYVIENVAGARNLLINPMMLCGSMFGLNIWRHRYFEIFPIALILTPPCNHSFVPIKISGIGNVYIDGKRQKRSSVNVMRSAIGIDWMLQKEIYEAIPPAYTEFIGKYLISIIKA